MGPLTTLGVGGPARFFLSAETEKQVIDGFAFARQNELRVFVLGGGSNILVSDKGFDGLVIQINLKGLEGGVTTTVAAGEDWDSFVEHCVNNNLAGVECLSGIPGTVGGTPVQNVGAYGQEVSETIVLVRCYDRVADEIVSLENEQCGFNYRTSIFNTSQRDRYVVLAVTYCLTPGGKSKIVYKDLVEHFAGREPTLVETREVVLSIRRTKSMVIEPNDPNHRSAGSFFKNPIVAREKFEKIAARFGGQVPQFAAGDGLVKIPAAWLIEKAGFRKGFAIGNAGISTNHTLAIINRGGAMAAEIVDLGSAIQAAVRGEFNIDLIPEPVFVGEF